MFYGCTEKIDRPAQNLFKPPMQFNNLQSGSNALPESRHDIDIRANGVFLAGDRAKHAQMLNAKRLKLFAVSL